MITERVWKNRDNTFSLELNANNVPQDITGLIKATLQFSDVVVDSAKDVGAFDWSTNGSNGELEIDIGMLAKVLVVPAGKYVARLTVYDATFPNGLEWGKRGFWLIVI